MVKTRNNSRRSREELYPRAVDALLRDELLPVFPAIMVVGPRGCGKSTSMSAFADTVLDLSEPGTRVAVSEDPDGVIARSRGTVLVDEWQEAPEVLGAVKRAVDSDRARSVGRFIITGSVRAAASRDMAWHWPVRSGADVRTDTVGDRTTCRLQPDRCVLWSGTSRGIGSHARRLPRPHCCREIPSSLKLSESNRDRWFAGYVDQLIERDALQVTPRSLQAPKLRAVLESSVARTGQELNKQATAKDAEVNVRTADSYLSLLEDLSVITRVPGLAQQATEATHAGAQGPHDRSRHGRAPAER